MGFSIGKALSKAGNAVKSAVPTSIREAQENMLFGNSPFKSPLEAPLDSLLGTSIRQESKDLTSSPSVDFDPSQFDAGFAQALANVQSPTGTLPQQQGQILGVPTGFEAALAGSVADIGDSRFATGQQNLAAQLGAQAQGQGISAVPAVLQQAQDENVRRQMALAASMSGRALPAAQRQLLQQQALGGQGIAQQAAILKAQEQQQAQQQLAALLAQGRGQDITTGQANQATALQVALANQAAQQQAAQAGSEQALAGAQFEAQSKADAAKLNLEAKQKREALEAEIALGKAGLQAGMDQTKLAATADVAAADLQAQSAQKGSIISGLGGLGAAMASDKRLKHDIRNVSAKDLNEFFSAMKPKSYKYNDEKYGDGTKVGFMMQDIENTKLGSMISRELPNGKKGYDPRGLEGILLAKFAMEQKPKKGKK